MDKTIAAKTVKDFLNDKKISYIELSEKLNNIGVKDTHVNLSNKINRGTFDFVFVLTLVEAIGYKIVLEEKFDDVILDKEEFKQKFKQFQKLCDQAESSDKVVLEHLKSIKEKLFTQAHLHKSLNKIARKQTDIDEYIDYLYMQNDIINEANQILVKVK